jgi:tRNA threonylcarbamoyladenosine biosynthesis protein TsaB
MAATILNLETASTNCSVSLACEGRLLALREENSVHYSHSEQLHPFIEEVLREAGKDMEALDAIAVSRGPGSYTGLRIGVSAAKGLCFALGIPLISLSTLKNMVLQYQVPEGVLIPVLDARRMEVYSAVFNKDYQEIRDTRAEVITPSSFAEYTTKGKVYVLGSGAGKCREIISHPNVVFYEDVIPSAREMVVPSFEIYCQGKFEDTAYFEPLYLKDFMAGGKAKGR